MSRCARSFRPFVNSDAPGTSLFQTAMSPVDPAPTEIPRLVRDAQCGDREAFAQLYERFTRMVHGIVLARIDRTEVDDVVQDVFLTALDRLRDLREPAAFGGWLAAIARHRAADHGRRRVHQGPGSAGGARDSRRGAIAAGGISGDADAAARGRDDRRRDRRANR